MEQPQTYGFAADSKTARIYVGMLMTGSAETCKIAHREYIDRCITHQQYQNVIQAVIDVLEMNRYVASQVESDGKVFDEVINQVYGLKAMLAQLGGTQ